MRVALLYNLVERPTEGGYMPADWHEVVARFVREYRAIDVGAEHDLVVCTSGASLSESSRRALEGLRYRTLTYLGSGWDIGAFQWSAGQLQEYDALVCMNTQAHPARPGWLGKLIQSWTQHGPGVYGTSSSFEVAPHVRTSCIMASPSLLQAYPLRVRGRHDACVFEHSPRNFSLWARQRGLPVYVVMDSGALPLAESRRAQEIFRKGRQADLLVHDRHTLIYDSASSDDRLRLQALADGEIPSQFVFLGPIDRLCDRHLLLRRLRMRLAGLKAALR